LKFIRCGQNVSILILKSIRNDVVPPSPVVIYAPSIAAEVRVAEIVIYWNVEVPLSVLWQSWDWFGEIDQFHPKVLTSRLVSGSVKTGIGAERCCRSAVGEDCRRERIIAYQPEEYMVIEISDATSLLQNARITLDFLALSRAKSRTILRIALSNGSGLIRQIAAFLFRVGLRKTFSDLLDANAFFLENGEDFPFVEPPSQSPSKKERRMFGAGIFLR
jgi:hypothetical protein